MSGRAQGGGGGCGEEDACRKEDRRRKARGERDGGEGKRRIPRNPEILHERGRKERLLGEGRYRRIGRGRWNTKDLEE